MEKTKYEECKIEVIVFDGQDVIVTSPGDCDYYSGDNYHLQYEKSHFLDI